MRLVDRTILALGNNHPYVRSVERLWMDGGSERGFLVGRWLGLTTYYRDKAGRVVHCNREAMVGLTDKGYERYLTLITEPQG